MLVGCATALLKDDRIRPPPDFARLPATEGVLLDTADEDGDLYWVDSNGRVDSQPARGSSQRVMDAIFKIFPKNQF
ncbi:MAG: hypothetical protein U9R74_11250 [Pseudomonadota bacterium]|nr:hypothetical protein [Pseudomonadota bacterium]